MSRFDPRRRQLLQGTALGALAGGALPAPSSAASGPAPDAAPTPGSTPTPGRAPGAAGRMHRLGVSREFPPAGVAGKALVNRPRASAVMAEHGLDGLVALNWINVYYLANTLPVMTKFRSDFGALATLARDEQAPSFVVTSTAQAWDLVNGEREVPELIAVSGVANWQDYVGGDPQQMKVEPKASAGGYALRPGVPLTAREQRWMAAQRRYGAEAAATPAWALARALRRSGLEKGRIGVDDMRVKLMLDEIGFTGVTCVPAAGVFRQVRMVKTAPELALMRIAGRNNATASLNAIRAIEPGMRFEEVERLFQAECAVLGSEMTSFLAGVSIGSFPDGVAVRGKPFLIDAVSHYRQYHGDFSRTVCLGEPGREILERDRAHRNARDAVLATVKAGVKFSELRRVAREAAVKSGMPAEVLIVNPHSLGLEHGDNPARADGTYGPPLDTALEEDMVVTVDLPYIEVGFGAGHHEDMLRVTRNGYEPMHPEGDPLVIV
jgi:Xaa-Pro aminopeptidase